MKMTQVTKLSNYDPQMTPDGAKLPKQVKKVQFIEVWLDIPNSFPDMPCEILQFIKKNKIEIKLFNQKFSDVNSNPHITF